MKHKIMWAILILLLPACGTTQPVATSSPIPDTSTASRVPTRTPKPTETLWPTRTPQPTLDLENILFEVNYSISVSIENMLASSNILISRDHELVVDYGGSLRIMNMSGDVFLEIPADFGYQMYDGVIWSSVQWSPDNKYIYFSRVPLLDGGTIRRLYNGTGYWRFDIETSEIIEILPAPGESSSDGFVHFGLSTFSLSPDGAKLAYIRNEEHPLELVILSLNTGKGQRLDLKMDDVYDDAGDLTWSPDGSKIVFVRNDVIDRMDWESEFFSLWVIDLSTGNMEKIMDMGRPGYYIVSWEQGNIIKFEGNSYFDSLPANCRILKYDISVKDFVGFITATPVPTHWPNDWCYPTPTALFAPTQTSIPTSTLTPTLTSTPKPNIITTP